MIIRHISNACCLYEHKGFKLLADPWLTLGAFEGSWVHEPAIHTKVEDLFNVDAIYVSHLHPDHYDPETLKHFRKDIPILLLSHGNEMLYRMIYLLGFTNIIRSLDGQSHQIGPFNVTVYAPFCKHPFEYSSLGNFIDSAIVVEDETSAVLNANDNTPTVEAAEFLKLKHKPFAAAQLKDRLAGPYPACFSNLSHEEKLEAVKRLTYRQQGHAVTIATALRAKRLIPFAGAYKLGGELSNLNQYLYDPSTEEEFSEAAYLSGSPLVRMKERDEFDTQTLELTEAKLSKAEEPALPPYPYTESEDLSLEIFQGLFTKALERMRALQKRYDYYPRLTIHFRTIGAPSERLVYEIASIDMTKPGYAPTQQIWFTLPYRLLCDILKKKRNWNSAEVGCHIIIQREPNTYDPDLSSFMAFFHG